MVAQEIVENAGRLHDEFNSHGYVSIPGFFDPDEVAELRDNKERFVRDVVPGMPGSEVYYHDKNDRSTLKQLQQLWEHDGFFARMMDPEGKLACLASVCLGEGVRAVNMQYFNKPAQANTPTPPHQDGHYFHLTPNHAITMWFALEDVKPDQGCVNYVRGSHRCGMRPHGPSGTLGFSQAILDFGSPADRENTERFPCEAGHLIAHHSLTVHWADGNTSGNKSREAMGAIFYGENCVEDVVSKRAYEARLSKSLAAGGKI